MIDLVLVGDIDRRSLSDLTAKTERHIDRKIRTLILSGNEFERMAVGDTLMPGLELWRAGRVE